MDSYIDALNDVCAHNPDVRVYATLDRRWEQKRREKRIVGASANPGTYAAALDAFVARVHLYGHASLRAGYSYGASQLYRLVYQDSDTIASVLAAMQEPPDFIGLETFSNGFANETFDIAVDPDLERLRTADGATTFGMYGADYVRLGSPPIVLAAFGMDVESHTPAVVNAFYTGIRAKLEANDIEAAIFHDSLTDGKHRIDDGHHKGAVAAFAASLGDV
jgi:hypothetical protein